MIIARCTKGESHCARHFPNPCPPSFKPMTSPADDAALIARLTDKMARATPLPWAVEQCGDKCDDPVLGTAYLRTDTDCKNPLSGWLKDFDEEGEPIEYYRENIAFEWSSCDGRSGSSNVDFVVEAVNAMPALLDRLSALNAEREKGENEAYEIGKRDGYETAVQDIDLLTGGDGEYRACLGPHDPERDCPDADTMKRRIADRFTALNAELSERIEEGERLREALWPIVKYIRDGGVEDWGDLEFPPNVKDFISLGCLRRLAALSTPSSAGHGVRELLGCEAHGVPFITPGICPFCADDEALSTPSRGGHDAG